MQLEVGNIYEGKVTGITKFGAFVELDAKTTGMVHISEVANTFVNEIKDHLQEGQTVKVKVLTVGDDGKISLSIKKALPQEPREQRQRSFSRDSNGGNREGGNGFKKNNAAQGQGGQKNFQQKNGGQSNNNSRPQRYDQRQATVTKSGDLSFEDMLSKFKQNSEEKMSDLKHIIDNRRKGASRRGK